jgi:hypothetical protein
MSEYQELLESSQKTMLISMPVSCVKRHTNKDVVEPVYIDLKDNISSKSENTISFESEDNISSEPDSMSELCEDEEPKNYCARNSYIMIPIATFLMGAAIAGFTFSMIISSQIIKT